MFKLLYLLNHISCFNKICGYVTEYPHKKSESLAQTVLPLLKYNFFSRACFIGTPCIC